MTKGQGSLARALRALESSEGSERKMVADVVGSLKKPCKAGRPDLPSGQMEESLSAKKSKLILGVQGLSIKPLSDPILERINPNVFMFESSLSSL